MRSSKARDRLLTGEPVASNKVRGVPSTAVGQAASRLERAGYTVERERGEGAHAFVTYKVTAGPDWRPAARGRARSKSKVPAVRGGSSPRRRAGRGAGDLAAAGSLAPPLGATVQVRGLLLDDDEAVHLVLRNGSGSWRVRVDALVGAGAR